MQGAAFIHKMMSKDSESVVYVHCKVSLLILLLLSLPTLITLKIPLTILTFLMLPTPIKHISPT
jgi:hypothetical protein